MKSFFKSFGFWLVLFIGISLAFNSFTADGDKIDLSYSDFITAAENGNVSNVTIQGNNIRGKLKDGQDFRSYAPFDQDLVPILKEKGVNIEALPRETSTNNIIGILLGWLPWIVIIGVWIYVMRGMGGAGGGGGRGGAMGFGRSKAKRINPDELGVGFPDVAGIDEAKEELEEIVDFLKLPDKYHKLGGRVPRGVLLVGPPGTGKTLLAKAIAGEAQVPFFSISGSDFVEMFVGVGASRVRDMFTEARKASPCILFIDEIDAIGRARGPGHSGGHEEREQTLNQMLVEMDGFSPTEGVIVLAATNRADVLDKALLRPGRFDRQITVNNPDVAGRTKIIEVHMKKIKYAPDVEPTIIARGTPGFSGADLENLINEAALLAARKDQNLVTMREMDEARDKVLMGLERRSLKMKEEDIKLTAYHEAGHAIVTMLLDDADPIHKATIIPRGQALGMVQQLPEDDQVSKTRAQYKADLAVYMGGRVAEELTFGHDKVTSGASSDIQGATQIAQIMVRRAGLSEKIGPVYHAADELESGKMKDEINREVKLLIDEAHATATDIIKKNNKKYIAIAEALLKFETLTGDEIQDIIDGKELAKERDNIYQLGGTKVETANKGLPSTSKNKKAS